MSPLFESVNCRNDPLREEKQGLCGFSEVPVINVEKIFCMKLEKVYFMASDCKPSCFEAVIFNLRPEPYPMEVCSCKHIFEVR